MLARRMAVITTAVAVATGGGFWLHQQAQAKDKPAYRTVASRRATSR